MSRAEEEAERLINLFPIWDWDEEDGYVQNMDTSKQYAIRCVEEIQQVVPRYDYGQGEKHDSTEWEYYEEVINQIKKKYN